MDDKVVIGGLIWIIVGMYFKERGETPPFDYELLREFDVCWLFVFEFMI